MYRGATRLQPRQSVGPAGGQMLRYPLARETDIVAHLTRFCLLSLSLSLCVCLSVAKSVHMQELAQWRACVATASLSLSDLAPLVTLPVVLPANESRRWPRSCEFRLPLVCRAP